MISEHEIEIRSFHFRLEAVERSFLKGAFYPPTSLFLPRTRRERAMSDNTEFKEKFDALLSNAQKRIGNAVYPVDVEPEGSCQ